jgi:hypothetical protein
MLARLGDVLYWLGGILAALTIAIGVRYWIDRGSQRPEGNFVLIGFFIAAGLIWLIGRACRYVLSGK